MLINADFHVHSCFSMASSKDMLIKNMAPKSKLKGLGLLGTGDAFHPGWLDIIEESTTYSGDGIYSSQDMDFVLTTEVETKNKIHHLIIILLVLHMHLLHGPECTNHLTAFMTVMLKSLIL